MSIRFSGVKVGLHFFHVRSSPGVTRWALAICASLVRPNRQFPDAWRLAFNCWKLSRHATYTSRPRFQTFQELLLAPWGVPTATRKGCLRSGSAVLGGSTHTCTGRVTTASPSRSLWRRQRWSNWKPNGPADDHPAGQVRRCEASSERRSSFGAASSRQSAGTGCWRNHPPRSISLTFVIASGPIQ